MKFVTSFKFIQLRVFGLNFQTIVLIINMGFADEIIS